MKKTTTMALLIFGGLLLEGCSHNKQICNVNHEVVSHGQPCLTMAQVRNSIKNAAARRRWVCRDKNPYTLACSHHVRSHTANIEIDYNTHAFSIRYVSSTGMNARGNTIHKKYNRWIANLKKDIKRELEVSSANR